MRTVALLASLALFSASETVPAQEHHPGEPAHGARSGGASYAGFEKRAIKALSDKDVADLRAGRGMGLALAAELNGYPGPLHVLELAEKLELRPEQRAATATLLHEMKREARVIGEEVIAAEANLDRLFQARVTSADALDAAVRLTASAQGRLRAAHLRYHLRMVPILTEEQVAAYGRLRGYGASQFR